MEKTGHRKSLPSGEMRERVHRANRCIGELLLKLGAAPHTAGYSALLSGTLLLTEYGEQERMRLSDTLYPIVERFSANGCPSAEHAIRDTVRMCFSKQPCALRSTLFPVEQDKDIAAAYKKNHKGTPRGFSARRCCRS